MKLDTLAHVLEDEIKDLYSAENQLIKALPKMAKGVTSEELRSALEHHLKETETHVQRLEKVAKMLDVNPKGKKCMGMEGLIEEGKEVLGMDGEPEPIDAAVIGAAQRVEHYEIAAYGTARAHASQLGYSDVADLLGKTLEEEEQANEKLTQIAETQINIEATA